MTTKFEGGKPKVAVVGGGISGLTAAWKLRDVADVTLFEANDYIGGHTNTVDIEVEGMEVAVDTGFLVYNERTYPNLIQMFKDLDVETVMSDMSFSVCLPELNLEWAGTNMNTVFAQRRNLFRPKFLLMLLDIVRFNKEATAMVEEATAASGTDRKTAIKYFPWQRSLLGRAIMGTACQVQRPFLSTRLGDGYLLVASKP